MKGWTAWGDRDMPRRYPLGDGHCARVAAEPVPTAPARIGPLRHGRSRGRGGVRPGRRAQAPGLHRAGDAARRPANLAEGLRAPARHGDHPKAAARARVLPSIYRVDQVVFATTLRAALQSEVVRPLTRVNYHSVIEASCTIPIAMGPALPPSLLADGGGTE